jgi:hypothetical protein
MEATHLEAYLYGTPPGCTLAGYEFELLRGWTPEPKMTVRELEELILREEPVSVSKSRAKRWWQFWKR